MRGRLLHPPLLAALGAAGHGAQILVCDANYPASTQSPPGAPRIHLNLAPGLVDAVRVTEVIAGAVPIEAGTVMAPNQDGPYAVGSDPDIFAEFARVLRAEGGPTQLDRLHRWDFYRAAGAPEVAAVVVTGEERLYGNLLLRIGVVRARG
ncbi:RbsD/FucU family protein [Nocardioides acrostichi]|nr:RbsD/FucU family protein [Nocardioides acrostichi]